MPGPNCPTPMSTGAIDVNFPKQGYCTAFQKYKTTKDNNY